ncbi:uncharacterized protein ACLA_062140 [Aspergillus clavatus NRRL 1]|uniref:Uncharacterized protein n=1 Tax=Aspergillus clavatus (strain ATCC 1007 / CBS 513.65 / DSM 816 / NCTC 3887 / NRRL 1 / QM 1276 / 107) TaxID=344612 RepID=A1CCJ4_ASPCL|nr:uncharacterized protein ACLA_062140 [Aspergillus clavatus NRRL 1]EAW12251.1 hypothetical protein ACLA_062140 [Aspergillus clavatus NRRL 1]
MSCFVSDLVVEYRDDRGVPYNCIEIIDGNNQDIDAGFRGKFIYIDVGHATKPEQAITNIEVQVQENENKDKQDMVKGAGGAFRYLHTLKGSGRPIVDVKLSRRAEKVEFSTVQGLGYNHMSGDINAARGGGSLYLIWRTV